MEKSSKLARDVDSFFMGIYDRSYYREDESGFSVKRLTGGRSVVTNLIILNVAVFVLDALLGPVHPASTTGRCSGWLSLNELDFQRPWMWWHVLSYGFAHGGPPHLIGNMIGLFFFGRAAEAVYGGSKFLRMYLTAVVIGGVIWLLAAQVVPSDQIRILLGASGGVVATVLLFCLNFPQQKVFLLFLPFVGFPAWLLGVVYVGADLLGFLGHTGNNNVAFGVHLVGAAYAYLFFRTQWELTSLLSPGWAGKIPNPLSSKPRLRVHNPNGERDDPAIARRADAVLKKLHEQGEASLTAKERRILEEYSRSLKQRNR